MACTDGSCSTGTGITCGTGGWNGPKPGDPDNTSVLRVIPAYGGNDVVWTFPTTNSHAASHFNVFRGNNNNPDLAVRRAAVKGDFFFDKIPSDERWEYFYWIQIVSINGTYGEMIGPVSATPLPLVSEVIAELAGKINEGVLSETLKAKIGEISLLKTDLNKEVNDRLQSNAAIAEALSAVQSETAQAMTYLNQEITKRTADDEALLQSVNTMAVGLENNTAAIAQESLTRATEMNAFALQVNTAQASLDGKIAGVETTMGAAVQNLEQKADAFGALYTIKLNADGLAGGFGVYNDGTTVEAGFDVNRFWVGQSNTNALKPFVIEGDKVFLSNTVVPTIESNNYIPGTSGWKIRKDGPAEFSEIVIRGTGTFTGSIYADEGYFNGKVSAASVQAALGNAQYFSFNTPGSHSFTIPDGLDADTLRITIVGGDGGGGGGSSGYVISESYYKDNPRGGSMQTISRGFPGNKGGNGGSGAKVVFDIPYLSNIGRTFTFYCGSGGVSGSGGVWGGGGIVSGVAGTNGSSTTVDGLATSPGGLGGAPGGTSAGTSAGDSAGGTGGIAGSGSGIYDSGGSANNNTLSVGNGGNGLNGANGSVTFTIYNGNVLVKADSYQNLIKWLDTLGHGAVPSNARI